MSLVEVASEYFDPVGICNCVPVTGPRICAANLTASRSVLSKFYHAGSGQLVGTLLTGYGMIILLVITN